MISTYNQYAKLLRSYFTFFSVLGLWILVYIFGFPGGSDSKESAYSARDLGSIPVFLDLQPIAIGTNHISSAHNHM